MGSKKVGIALSDDGGTVAFPSGIISSGPGLQEELYALVLKHGVSGVVFGDSKHRDGSDNPIAALARSCAAFLRDRGITTHFEWEGYSSAHARTAMTYTEGSARGTVARKTKQEQVGRVDAVAASMILQSFLDRRGTR